MLFENAMIFFVTGIWFSVMTYLIVTDFKGSKFWGQSIKYKPNLAVTTIYAGMALAFIEQSLIISLV